MSYYTRNQRTSLSRPRRSLDKHHLIGPRTIQGREPRKLISGCGPLVLSGRPLPESVAKIGTKRSHVKRANVNQTSAAVSLFSLDKYQVLSVLLQGTTLISFAVVASFGLDFLLLTGRMWGFVIGVLIYGALCAACWNLDEDEALSWSRSEERLRQQAQDSPSIEFRATRPSRPSSLRTISKLQRTARG
jgi:hypothetical protein